MKTINNIILGCLLVTASNALAGTCVLESLTSNPVLTDQCKDAVDLNIDAKTIDMDHMATSNKTTINLPDGQIEKDIEIVNDSLVLLDWFRSEKVEGKNSIQHAISVETVNYSGIPYFILKRPTKMPYLTQFSSDYVMVPSANLVYNDKSSSIRATCQVGIFGRNLTKLFMPVTNSEGLFRSVTTADFLPFARIANFEIRYLLNMQGQKYIQSYNSKQYAAVSVKNINSFGPEVALLDLDNLMDLVKNKVCTASFHVNPNIRVATKVKPAEVVEPVKSEDIQENQTVLKESKRRGD